MSVNFPTSLDSLPNPTSTDLLENATLALDHDQQHSNANDAIEALEAKVGVDGSAVTTSHDYKLSGVTGSDKAVSKTGTETLTNKTLTSPVINVGSDATGDIYYRSAGGLFTRLAAGAADTILAIQAGLPAWISNPSAADSSYTVKGIVKFLTDAATSGITVASGVANVNTGTGANQIVKLNSSAQIPAVSGALLTNLPSTLTSSNGTTTKNAADASATQTIAHGLSTTPKSVEIRCTLFGSFPISGSSNYVTLFANTFYNGTTQSSQSFYTNDASPGGAAIQDTSFTLNTSNGAGKTSGVVTVDSTNISIAWTKTNSPTGTYNIMWRALL